MDNLLEMAFKMFFGFMAVFVAGLMFGGAIDWINDRDTYHSCLRQDTTLNPEYCKTIVEKRLSPKPQI